MGIGTTAAKQLLSAVTGTPDARQQLAECVDVLNAALAAIDGADAQAREALVEAHRSAYDANREAIVAARLASAVASLEPVRG